MKGSLETIVATTFLIYYTLLKMVQAWIEIHKEELYVDWELAVYDDSVRIA
jgi:hypothetical protein